MYEDLDLRDYFAGQYMSVFSAYNKDKLCDVKGKNYLAREAYRMADAMIKARDLRYKDEIKENYI